MSSDGFERVFSKLLCLEFHNAVTKETYRVRKVLRSLQHWCRDLKNFSDTALFHVWFIYWMTGSEFECENCGQFIYCDWQLATVTLSIDVRLSQHVVSKLVYTRLGLYGLLWRRFSNRPVLLLLLYLVFFYIVQLRSVSWFINEIFYLILSWRFSFRYSLITRLL